MQVSGQRFILVAMALSGAALFFALRASGMATLSGAQFVIFPVIFVALMMLRFLRFRVPYIVLAGAFISFLVAVYLNFRLPDEAGAYIFSRIKDDSYEMQTTLFREKLKNYEVTYLRPLALEASALRYYGEVQSFEQAKKLLDETRGIRAVVWGQSRWLNVSFREIEPVNLRELSGIKDALPLLIVSSVPVIGFSLQPATESAAFLTELLSNPLVSGSVLNQQNFSKLEAEISLIKSGRILGGWTSFAHRAYPWWLLGNLYLAQAFSSDKLQTGYLNCAQKAYRRALGFLRAQDNLELYAAILNNFAVLEYLDFLLEGNEDKLESSLQYFRRGSKAQKKLDGWGQKSSVAIIARNNLRHLRRFEKNLVSEKGIKVTTDKVGRQGQKGRRKRERLE
jgi:hypothetical protein